MIPVLLLAFGIEQKASGANINGRQLFCCVFCLFEHVTDTYVVVSCIYFDFCCPSLRGWIVCVAAGASRAYEATLLSH